MSSITFDNFPQDLTLNFHNNKTPLDSIPEEKEVNFSIMPSFKLQTTMSWADITEIEDMGIFHPFDPLNWHPTIANFLADEEEIDDNFLNEDPFAYEEQEQESYDPDNDISEFPNPLGQRVYFNQEPEEEKEQEICCKCSSMQDDGILLQIGEKTFLCTECFYQEKQNSLRQNTEYEIALRRKEKIHKNINSFLPKPENILRLILKFIFP